MRLLLLALFVIPVSALASACSSDSSKDSTVNVALSEWAVVTDPDSVPAGRVTFEVKNNGEQTHELVVIRTDFESGDLPTNSDGSVDQGASGLDVIGETNEIDPGKSDTRVFSLNAGKYVLLCNLVKDDSSGQKQVHYQNGMRTGFNVTAAQ